MCVYLLVRLNRFSMWYLTTYRLYVSSGNHFAGPYSIQKLWVCITNDMLIHLHAMFSVHSLFFFSLSADGFGSHRICESLYRQCWNAIYEHKIWLHSYRFRHTSQKPKSDRTNSIKRGKTRSLAWNGFGGYIFDMVKKKRNVIITERCTSNGLHHYEWHRQSCHAISA